MKCWITVCLLLAGVSSLFGQSPSYQRFFTDAAMRVDYFHTGNGREEIFSVDAIYEERTWAGPRRNLIDTLNLGQYLLKVYDLSSGKLLYSCGFSSIFGEWKTTAEARRGIYRTFHESLRFPFPKRPVRVVVAGRDSLLRFTDRFSLAIDPASAAVNRELLSGKDLVREIQVTGPDSARVDLLFLGDGYTRAQAEEFFRDVQAFVDLLFKTPPYAELRTLFNVRALFVPSEDAGIDEPARGKWRRTALGFSFNTFGIARYALSLDNRGLRNVTARVPYDVLCVLLNTDRYGGGGIFGLYSATFTGKRNGNPSRRAGYVFLHELAHHFAGLGDEYYHSTVAYEEFYPKGVEPWEPNITALLDPAALKWRDLVAPDTPVPTPWKKAEYDSLGEIIARLSREDRTRYREKIAELRNRRDEMLREEPFWGKVGAFEGAGYQSRGLFRPFLSCIMFSIETEFFCPVCKKAIEERILFLTK